MGASVGSLTGKSTTHAPHAQGSAALHRGAAPVLPLTLYNRPEDRRPFEPDVFARAIFSGDDERA